MLRVMKTSVRQHISKYIRITILIVGIMVAYDLRVVDYILSGNTNLITVNMDDLEIFNEAGALKMTRLDNFRKIKRSYQIQTGNKITANKPCQDQPSNLMKWVTFRDTESSPPSLENIRKENQNVFNGGHFSPTTCKPRYKVAIIIPFRKREQHLRIFLAHMHPIWQRQEIEYKVFVVTQAGDEYFNRAKLMNIGVAEAEKDGQFDCYVFQDVDLLLEDDRCLYWCHKENPRHLSMYVDKFSYKRLSYNLRCPPLSMSLHEKISVLGGVTMLSREQYQAVNGFSNLYWGWGGEDDDLYMRVKNKGYGIDNPYGKHCSFRMIKHEHSSGSPNNNASFSLIFHAMNRMDIDGYKNLRYRRLTIDMNPLYTNVTVDIGQPSAKMKNFMKQTVGFSWTLGCRTKMPWDQ